MNDAQKIACMSIILEMCSSEGASLTIFAGNPEGDPNNAVELNCHRTDWQTVRYTGQSLVEAVMNVRDDIGGVVVAPVSNETFNNMRGYHKDEALRWQYIAQEQARSFRDAHSRHTRQLHKRAAESAERLAWWHAFNVVQFNAILGAVPE